MDKTKRFETIHLIYVKLDMPCDLVAGAHLLEVNLHK